MCDQRHGRVTVAMLWPKYDVNVGLLARTCEAFGADMVTTCRTNPLPANTPKYPPYTIAPSNVNRWLRRQFESRDRVIVVETGGKPLVQEAPVTTFGDDVLLLLGHESTGTPSWVMDHPKARVATIPMRGMSPSINVAVAGSIALAWLSGAHDDESASEQPLDGGGAA